MVRHAGLFTSSYHNSLRSGSLALRAWNATKSRVVVWSRDFRAQKTCLERSTIDIAPAATVMTHINTTLY